MLKKIKTKTIIIGSVVLLAAILLIGFTYAYFTAIVSGNDTAKTTQVYAGIMSLELDGTTQVTCNNLYPGGTCTYNFSVENTGTLTTSYELDFVDVLNDFATKSELVYSLNRDSQVVIEEQEAPSINEMILPAVVIAPGTIQQYTLTLTFKETGTDQSNNQDKHFGARVNIRGIDSSNYLQAKVLARHIYNETPDFSAADPVRLLKEKIRYTEGLVGSSNITGNQKIGTGYTFNPRNGLYTLTGVSENQTYNRSSIGKYTCTYTIGNACGTMVKIKEVEESSATTNYTENVESNNTTTLNASGVSLSSTYTLDDDTGNFVLAGTIEENQTYNASSIGKYTCNNASTTCTTLYKINQVIDTNVTNSDIFTRIANTNRIIKSDRYTKERTNRIYSQSGLYSAQDDLGTSYYFRGKIDNNYVSFANNLWRIVRINGDGSIRMILAGNTGTNVSFDVTNSLGYTKKNESPCTNDSPCISDYDSTSQTFINNKTVTNSVIKNYIENTWYKANLTDYNEKIVLGNYCNDSTSLTTSIDTFGGNASAPTEHYGSYLRLARDDSPTLICPDTDKNFGGFYQSKVGLASADEATMAGMLATSGYAEGNVDPRYRNLPEETNYLYHSSNWWLMSPRMKNQIQILNGTRISLSNPFPSKLAVRPVINLKSDIQISGGDGSQSNPYLVE